MKKGFVISTALLSFSFAGIASAETAWVWANAQKSASYTANAQFSNNPDSGKIHIKRSGPGKYEVKFGNLGGGAKITSNVQVSSYGAGSNMCKVAGWSPSGNGLTVRVSCFTASGTPSDSQFSALVTYEKGKAASTSAFAWCSNARATHKAPAKFVSNSKRPVEIKRLKLGHYDAVFTGLTTKSKSGGNVQVTAYGQGNEQCKVKGWRKANRNFVASVACFQPNGAAADSQFSVLVNLP